MAKQSKKLKKPDVNIPKPKFAMAEPNDDLEAHGWDLKNIRYPSKDSTADDVWPGRCIFNIEQDIKSIDRYGVDARFICPKYLQIALDQSPELREAALAAKKAGYTKAAVERLQATIVKIFEQEILPDIAAKFYEIAAYIAQFYAARLAYASMRQPEPQKN